MCVELVSHKVPTVVYMDVWMAVGIYISIALFLMSNPIYTRCMQHSIQ